MTATDTRGTKPIMFYDGGCPLCSREVDHYRRVDKNRNVLWLDIHADPEALQSHGISYEAAMKHLHVINPRGEIVRGAFAFREIWRALPRYRVLAALVSFPGLSGILDRLYNRFAERRFSKRIACATSNDQAPAVKAHKTD